MDPVTIGALASVAVAALGAGKQAPPTPGIAQSNPVVNSWMDSSGWTVATSGSKAQGGARSQAGALGDDTTLLLIGAGLIGIAVWATKSK